MSDRSDVRIAVDDAAPADWDDFVHRCPASSHSHLAGWGTVFRESFGHRTRYWTARDHADRLIAILPVTLVRSLLFGRHAVSVPYLNAGGPVGETSALAPLVEAAVTTLAADGYRSIQLRARQPIPVSYPPRLEKVTVTMPLAESAEAQLARFDAKLRSQIRRAGKAGATSGVGPDRLADFHAVFIEHMRDLGSPAMPRAFFDVVCRTFPNEFRIATVAHEGEPIAGGFGFRWRDAFEITWASSLMRHKRMAPNMLLYWTLITQCIAEGVRCFDFGRATPGSGPHHFKRQWSDDETYLPWYEAGHGPAVVRPKKEAGPFRLATRLWTRLPLAVATPVGARLVRGIP